MYSNMLQQLGYNMPPSDKRQSSINTTADDSQNLITSHKPIGSPEKENTPVSKTDVLPGYGFAHLSYQQTETYTEDRNIRSTTLEECDRFMPYSVHSFMTTSRKMVPNLVDLNKTKSSKDDSMIDVENDSHDHLRSSDMPSFTDSSLSTQGYTSPQSNGSTTSPSGSAKSSPSSTGEPVCTPESETKQTKKKARTTYTKEQIETLMKIFHENPYPDSEMMEKIGLDLGVPENKVKIWFQNKRARWRRRVNNPTVMANQFMAPTSPMLSPVSPYGFMSNGHMMTSSPTPFMYPGYYNYAVMTLPTTSYQPTNNAASRLQPTYQPVTSTPKQTIAPVQQQVASSLPYSTRSSPPLTAMTSSIQCSPPLTAVTSSLPYSSTNSPLSEMTSLPFSTRNSPPLPRMTSPSARYQLYTQFTGSV